MASRAAFGLQRWVAKPVAVTLAYSSEKQEWLVPLIQQFNDEKHKTDKGRHPGNRHGLRLH